MPIIEIASPAEIGREFRIAEDEDSSKKTKLDEDGEGLYSGELYLNHPRIKDRDANEINTFDYASGNEALSRVSSSGHGYSMLDTATASPEVGKGAGDLLVQDVNSGSTNEEVSRLKDEGRNNVSDLDNGTTETDEATTPVNTEKPIRFKDAVGRKFSFPFHIVATWAGMEELIKQAFLHVDTIGPEVQEGHYDLIGPDGEIILPQVWESMIEPGWEIVMHMWATAETLAPPIAPPAEGVKSPGLPSDIGNTDPMAFEYRTESEMRKEIRSMIAHTVKDQARKLNGWRAQFPLEERTRQIYQMLVISTQFRECGHY